MRENPLAAGLGLPREPPPLSIVIFGASGDLTRRKLVPALFSAVPQGPHRAVAGHRRRPARLDHGGVPLPGARGPRRGAVPADRPRAQGRLRRAGGVRTLGLRRCRGLPGARGQVPRPAEPDLLPRHPARRLRAASWSASAPRGSPTSPGDSRASSSRSRSAATSRARRPSTRASPRRSPRSRSSASTTTSARRPCRTSCCCASATGSSSRSGTTATSTTCRSPWRRPSASRDAAATTRPRARCATWSRTTCCSCCASSPWSRRSTCARTACAARS